ncbi:ubiquitin ligase complex subunit HRD3 PWA37_004283 [Arxiozyma heterogenica]|uniref:ubiquitin ligase complex subunit HRD3 n=1 Tax=Arxiozyma heterogenica TaxID=278026 RepID=UPI002EDC81FF
MMWYLTIYCSAILPILYVISTAIAIDEDTSWIQAQELMKSMTKRIHPLSNPSLYFGHDTDITFTIPLDYIPEYEEYKFDKFWTSENNLKQKQLYDLLRDSSYNFMNANATYILMRNFLYQEYGFPHNKKLAFYYIDKFNQMTNYTNPETLFHQGIMFMTGLLGEIPIDEAKGLLYIQKSANMGNLQARQTLAYKYLHGINVPTDIEKSLLLYRHISHELKSKYFSDNEWNIVTPYIEGYNIRLPDFDGGLLDPELRQTPLSTVRKKSVRPDITSSILTKMNSGNIVLQFSEDNEPSSFAPNVENENGSDQLVDIFYAAWDEFRGTYTKLRNCTRTRELLELVYTNYKEDVPIMDNLQKFFYCNSLDLLGHLYFTGQGMNKPDIERAKYFLTMSKSLLEESPSTLVSRSNIDLGLISQYFSNNITEAVKYYQNALHIRSNNGIAEYQLSKLSEKYPEMKLGDPFMLMKNANWKGYTPARFEFAKLIEKSMKTKYDTSEIANIYKKFVETNEHITAPYLKDAFSELLIGNSEVALWYYTLAAEQGFEQSQVSAASLLYQIPYKYEELPVTPKERKILAASYYTRAFKQDNLDAGVIGGDVYYHLGEYEKAFALYQAASGRQSLQALWNMGYMYENGLGTPKDYHLAKRFYDEVYFVNNKLLLASKVSVWKLEIKKWIDWMNDGKETFWRIRWHRFCFNILRIKNYIQSWFKAKRLHHKLIVENEADDGDKIYNNIQRMINHKVSDINFDSHNDANDVFDMFGFTFEDLAGILLMLFIFIVIIIFRHMGVGGEWNIVINGVHINGRINNNNNNNNADEEGNPNGDQGVPDQNPWGNVDIHFAI